MPTDKQKHGMGNGFQTFATKTSAWMGSRWSFLGAILIIVAWAVLGPHFLYSDTWQLVVNTATTIVTFLMVFLIQNTQNRDARALHLKLDEIIRAIESARNELIDIERLSDDDLETLSKSFEKIRMECESRTRRGNRTNAEHERRSEGTPVESSVD
jgi:low affinity Fe/Cu permease